MTTLTRDRRTPRARGGVRIDVQALHDMTPIVVSILPFGMLVGVSIGRLGLAPVAALLDTFLIYSGSAQLAATSLLEAGGSLAAVLTAVLSGLVAWRFRRLEVTVGAAIAAYGLLGSLWSLLGWPT